MDHAVLPAPRQSGSYDTDAKHMTDATRSLANEKSRQMLAICGVEDHSQDEIKRLIADISDLGTSCPTYHTC